MIDSFNKVIGYYALCYIVKYTPVVGRVVQEKSNKEVRRKPRFLAFVPDIFKTQKMCEKVVGKGSWLLGYIPDHLKKQEMCNEALGVDLSLLKHVRDHFKTQNICKGVRFYPRLIGHVPDIFKTQEMCNKAVEKDPYYLRFVPDWFVSKEQLKLWHDINDWLIRWWYNNRFIKWCRGYKKLKVQKASIKEEYMPTVWHPSRYWDWCMSEDEKKETEELRV